MAQGLFRRGWDEAQSTIEAAKVNAKKWGTREFNLKNDSMADIVFLDGDDPLGAPYHTIYTPSRGYSKFLCLGKDCPACEAGYRPSDVWFFTVMHLTHLPTVDAPDFDNDDHWELLDGAEEQVSKSGDLYRNPVRLLVAKRGTMEILMRQKDRRDGLTFARYHVERTGDPTSPAVGDIWEFETKYDEDAIAILNPEAAVLDYEEVVTSLTAEEIEAELVGHAPPQNNNGPRGGRQSRGSTPERAPSRSARGSASRASGDGERPARKLNW